MEIHRNPNSRHEAERYNQALMCPADRLAWKLFDHYLYGLHGDFLEHERPHIKRRGFAQRCEQDFYDVLFERTQYYIPDYMPLEEIRRIFEGVDMEPQGTATYHVVARSTLRRLAVRYLDLQGSEWWVSYERPENDVNLNIEITRNDQSEHESFRNWTEWHRTEHHAWVIFDEVLEGLTELSHEVLRHFTAERFKRSIHMAVWMDLVGRERPTDFLEDVVHRLGGMLNMLKWYQEECKNKPTDPSEMLAHMACEAMERYIYNHYVRNETQWYTFVDMDAEETEYDDDDEAPPLERTYLADLLFDGSPEMFACHEGECELCSDNTEPLYTLPCKHEFGLTCLSDWTKQQYKDGEPTTCPMCRAPY